MKKQTADSILQKGDMFEIKDEKDNDYKNHFLVVEEKGAGYEIAQISSSKADTFGIYPSDLPDYEKIAFLPLDKMKDRNEEKINISKIAGYLDKNVGNLKDVTELGLHFAFFDNDELNYKIGIKFDGCDVGNVYFELKYDGSAYAKFCELDIGQLIDYDYDKEPKLNKQQIREIRKIFKKLKLQAPHLKHSNESDDPFKQDIDLINPKDSSDNFTSVKEAYNRLEKVLSEISRDYKIETGIKEPCRFFWIFFYLP